MGCHPGNAPEHRDAATPFGPIGHVQAQVAIRTVGVRPHTSESPTSRQSKPSTRPTSFPRVHDRTTEGRPSSAGDVPPCLSFGLGRPRRANGRSVTTAGSLFAGVHHHDTGESICSDSEESAHRRRSPVVRDDVSAGWKQESEFAARAKSPGGHEHLSVKHGKVSDRDIHGTGTRHSLPGNNTPLTARCTGAG